MHVSVYNWRNVSIVNDVSTINYFDHGIPAFVTVHKKR